MLGHDERPVAMHLGDRKPDAGDVRHLLKKE
jgi:hypothetical protein